jgi:hypothetical protein
MLPVQQLLTAGPTTSDTSKDPNLHAPLSQLNSLYTPAQPLQISYTPILHVPNPADPLQTPCKTTIHHTRQPPHTLCTCMRFAYTI